VRSARQEEIWSEAGIQEGRALMLDARRISTRGRLLLLALATVVGFTLLQAASALAVAPHWKLATTTAPTHLVPGSTAKILIFPTNLGDAAVDATGTPVTIADKLPTGLKAIAVSGLEENNKASTCPPTKELNPTEPSCTYSKVLQPYEQLKIVVTVKVEAPVGTEASLTNEVEISGGNAPAASARQALSIGGAPAQFGIEKYELRPENEDGSTDTQAGSHPFQLTSTLAVNETSELEPVALPKDLSFILAPGLIGNPLATPQCNEQEFLALIGTRNLCKAETAVGVATVRILEPNTLKGLLATREVPVFNLTPSPGEPARFGFEVLKSPVILDTAVKSGGDYGVIVSARQVTETAGLVESSVSFWGVPGDPRHDASRGWECIEGGAYYRGVPEACKPLGLPQKQFLSLPTSCGTPLTAPMQARSWAPKASFLAPVRNEADQEATPTNCGALQLTPSIDVQPSQTSASTPTGMNVNVSVPQTNVEGEAELAQSAVKSTTVTLPEGLVLSPAAASGLQACGALQIGFTGFELNPQLPEAAQLENDHFSPTAETCPKAAKVGTVKIVTPLLKNPLLGSVYLAAQDTNPFQAPLVLYVAAFDEATGVRVKLAGTVVPNPVNGQLVSTFENTPEVPFESLELSFFDGNRAAQSTPPLCGSYTTTAAFTPWSGNPAANVSATKPFSVTAGVGGTPCPSSPLPFAPAFLAGSTNTQAAGFTPFTLTIGRPDGQQALDGITVHLPEGMAAILASVTPCQEPPLGQPWACGPASLLGHATTSSGLGGEPFSLNGNVYITTGYHGAPFGLLVETDAKAGPFDLGLVDVRSRIDVDPSTAAVTVTTDGGPRGEIVPTFLKGVPVQLKQINATIDRPSFQFNPTSCDATNITGTLNGDGGATSAVSSPFQVTGCASLPFAPKLSASSGHQGSKANGIDLNVTVESAGLGQANIKKVALTLPAALPSRLTTIQKACLAAVFAVNPATCPEGSNIGSAKISTPVLKSPLEGPAYLVSYGKEKFPDVELVLQGEGILLILDGHTDIKKGITYSRFEAAPDAPFAKFVTELPAGPHSALTAFVPVARRYSLCGAKLPMPTEIVGQNGAVIKGTTNIAVTGCPKGSGSVLSFKQLQAKRLIKALKACHKKRNRHRRVACEKQARKKYGPKKAVKKHSKS
jgi:hypothetical protein